MIIQQLLLHVLFIRCDVQRDLTSSTANGLKRLASRPQARQGLASTFPFMDNQVRPFSADPVLAVP